MGVLRTSIFLLAAAAGWVGSHGQTVVSQVEIPDAVGDRGYNPYGAGYADGHFYFCNGESQNHAWKLATGNANGPSDAPPVPVNRVTFSTANCYDMTVDSTGVAYYALNDFFVSPAAAYVGKTNGQGTGPMTLVGEYTIAGSSNEKAQSIALDEEANFLYVGCRTKVYKLMAGGPNDPVATTPSATLSISTGTNVYALTLDTKNGYGYAGMNSGYVIQFSLDTMTEVGSAISAFESVQALAYNPLTSALYAAFNTVPPDAQMWNQEGTGLVDRGPFNWGQGEAVYTARAMSLSSSCNFLATNSLELNAWVNFLDMRNGTVVPMYQSAVYLDEEDGMAGAFDEYGYSYWTTGALPTIVYKVSNPVCTSPNPVPSAAGVPFMLKGFRAPAKRPVRVGSSFKVTFVLNRLAMARSDMISRRELAMLKNKTAVTWEDFDVTVTLPGTGMAVKGVPRVSPRIANRKAPDVTNSTHIAWNNVPMRVDSGSKKNYVRKFTLTAKVDRAFAGSHLNFTAVATGPHPGWESTYMVTVPIVAGK